jgi:plastocyanin
MSCGLVEYASSLVTALPRATNSVQIRGPWQHRYKVGDPIRWGGNDVGEPGHKVVVVEGYPERCPKCGQNPDQTYDVTRRDDVIDCVRPSDGTYDYVGSGQDYFVVQP